MVRLKTFEEIPKPQNGDNEYNDDIEEAIKKF